MNSRTLYDNNRSNQNTRNNNNNNQGTDNNRSNQNTDNQKEETKTPYHRSNLYHKDRKVISQTIKYFDSLEDLFKNEDISVKPVYIKKGELDQSLSNQLEQIAIVCTKEEALLLDNPKTHFTYSIAGYSGLQKFDLHLLLKDWQFIPCHLLKPDQYVDYLIREKTHDNRIPGLKYNVLETTLYTIKCMVTNVAQTSSFKGLFKTNLYKTFGDLYVPKCVSLDLYYLNPNKVKRTTGSNPYLIKITKPSILKPADGTHGNDIFVVENQEGYQRAIDNIQLLNSKRTTPYKNYVLCDYILNSDTISLKDLGHSNDNTQRKYHIRTYIMISNWGAYSFRTSHIWLAGKKYIQGNWTDRYIHDSRHKTTETDFSINQDDWRYEKIFELKKAIMNMYHGPKAKFSLEGYEPSLNYYEILGLDVMFDKEKKIYLIECNRTPGMEGKDPNGPMFKAFQKEMHEWSFNHIKHLFYTYIDPSFNVNLKANYASSNSMIVYPDFEQMTYIGPSSLCQNMESKGVKIIACLNNAVDRKTILANEYKYITVLNRIELEEYLYYVSVAKPNHFKTYNIFGSMGVPHIYYHKYFKNFILQDCFTNSDFRLYNDDGRLGDIKKKVYGVESILTSVVDDKSVDNICNKARLYENVPELMAEQYPIDINQIKFPCIIKPAGSLYFGGRDIQVCYNKTDYGNYSFEKNVEYVICEYINDPKLYNPQNETFVNYHPENAEAVKFHLRIYFIVTSWGYSELHEEFRVLTAADPYKNDDALNKGIHDTHAKSTSQDIIYPKDDHILNQVREIYKKVVSLVKPRPYPESKLAYEVFSLDCMIRGPKDKVVLLECNNLTGLNMKSRRTKFEHIMMKHEENVINSIVNLDIINKEKSIKKCLIKKYFKNYYEALYYHDNAKKQTFQRSNVEIYATNNINIDQDIYVIKQDKSYIVIAGNPQGDTFEGLLVLKE